MYPEIKMCPYTHPFSITEHHFQDENRVFDRFQCQALAQHLIGIFLYVILGDAQASSEVRQQVCVQVKYVCGITG